MEAENISGPIACRLLQVFGRDLLSDWVVVEGANPMAAQFL
jgi:hypothetical protein